MTGIYILESVAFAVAVCGLSLVVSHAIFSKMGLRQPVRVLNWLFWALLTLAVAMFLYWFYPLDWWYWPTLGWLAGVLCGITSALKSSYLMADQGCPKWTIWFLKEQLVVDWNHGWKPLFSSRIKKQQVKKQCGHVSVLLRFLKKHPFVTWFTLSALVTCIWPGVFVGWAMVTVMILVRVVSWNSRLPLWAVYQRRYRKIQRGKQMFDIPNTDSHGKIRNSVSGVAVFSWVDHWSKTVFSPVFAGALGVSIVFFLLGIWFHCWPFFPIACISFLIPTLVVEISRVRQVYTYESGSRRIFQTPWSWINWKSERVEVVNFNTISRLEEDEKTVFAVLGCLYALTTQEAGKEVHEVLKWIPWPKVLYPAIMLAASPYGGSIGPAWFYGFHFWPGWLREIYLKPAFGDLFRQAERGWDEIDPVFRVQGEGYHLSETWATARPPDRKTLDLEKKPHHAIALALGFWEAWLAYNKAVKDGAANPEQAWRVGLDRLNELCQSGPKFIPARDAWEGKAPSPLSEAWKDVTFPALVLIVLCIGHFDEPSEYVRLLRRKDSYVDHMQYYQSHRGGS